MKQCKLCQEEISIFEADKNGEICDVCYDNQDTHQELFLIGDNRDQLGRRDIDPEPPIGDEEDVEIEEEHDEDWEDEDGDNPY